MAEGLKIEKIELNSKGISRLLSSESMRAVVNEAAETMGTVEKEYLSIDRNPGHAGATRWKAIVKENK